MRKSVPFCVVDRPFVVWGNDVDRDCEAFLRRVDADFYARAAQELIDSLDEAELQAAEGDKPGNPKEADQSHKDMSSLSRLLWHHGVETLAMLFGAYIQAPTAVHAYFLKCKTQDTFEIARALVNERRPLYSRINDVPFNIKNLLRGIHLCAGWSDVEDTIHWLDEALKGIFAAFTDEKHRWEYNSIKHGLRVSHGPFAFAFGIEEKPGVPAPAEAMRTIGYSREASFFGVVKPLRNATKVASRVNFKIDEMSVTWSLEKVFCDLQLLSLLIGNTVSALQIAAGAAPRTVKFCRPKDTEQWWQYYANLHEGTILSSSFGIEIDAKGCRLPTSDDVLSSYCNGTWNW